MIFDKGLGKYKSAAFACMQLLLAAYVNATNN
jgi:hypothetical protein